MQQRDPSARRIQASEKQALSVAVVARVVSALAIALSLFQLYTAGFIALPAMIQRTVHLSAIMALAFLIQPPFKGAKKDRLNGWLLLDIVLAFASVFCAFYVVYNMQGIIERQGDWILSDYLVSGLGILLVLEACRRVIGYIMTGICISAMVYAMYGPYMPDLLAHKGYSLQRISTTLFLTTEGIFGVPLYVASTFVFIFVLFGAFLQSTGGGNFFIDLAYALTGRFSGGPAKTAVIASGFMGSISGSAVGNVVATGSFTIPMMKSVGYRPHVAGAIEATASTGGQLMPPIMGAGAFLMAEFTNTSYLTIIKVAFVPAVMYYITVLLFVHFEAKKFGLKGQSKESLPHLWTVLKDGLHFILPVIVLIYVLMMNYSPMMAGFTAVVSTYVTAMFRKKSRIGLWKLLRSLEQGAKNAVMVSVACGAAGIIVGMVGLTGMGLKFSSLVLDLSFGIPILAILLIGAASLVLGMGLPVTASYIVLATLAGPALLDMGIPLLVTHMIVFWYSQDSNVTPPVSLASFAGAGIANADPMRTAFTSWKLAKGLYIIPIIMAYRPMLGIGEQHTLLHWEVIATFVTTTLGLVAFAAALERYLLRQATWLETFLLVVAAACLFWPTMFVDTFGFVLLGVVFLLHRVKKS
jgi:TRAP transporter 4TM/12TM fusion protein